MKYIFLTLGTKGDLNPFLGLACEMKRRGHQTLILTGETHSKDCIAAGIPFESIQSAEAHEKLVSHPNAWVPLTGIGLYLKNYILPAVEPAFRIIERHSQSGPVTVIGNNLIPAGLLAHEKLGVPFLSVFLAPYAHMSALEPAKDAPQTDFILKLAGAGGRRMIFGEFTKRMNSWMSPVHELRRDLGLPPVKDLMGEWRYSAPQILNLWPDWYCGVKSDWPGKERMHQVGFVDYEQAAGDDWISQLKIGDLLERRPLMFTMGSEMNQDLDHQYELFSQTCLRLRKPGLMISSAWRKPQPKNSSLEFRVINGAPYSQLFKRASVVLSHGGIGTVAKAIQARRPLVTAPLGFDQFDNGHLAARLGLGVSIPFRSMNTMNLGRALETALEISPAKVHALASTRPGAQVAGDIIEKMQTLARAKQTNNS